MTIFPSYGAAQNYLQHFCRLRGINIKLPITPQAFIARVEQFEREGCVFADVRELELVAYAAGLREAMKEGGGHVAA